MPTYHVVGRKMFSMIIHAQDEATAKELAIDKMKGTGTGGSKILVVDTQVTADSVDKLEKV